MTIQTEPQYKLRISEELREKIKTSAQLHNRSMNADIVARLEASFIEEDNKQREGIPLSFDEEWFDKTGLSKEELGAYVSAVVKKEIYKVDDK